MNDARERPIFLSGFVSTVRYAERCISYSKSFRPSVTRWH